MSTRFFNLLLLFCFTPVLGWSQATYKYDFKTVPNDPYNVLYHRLENGLEIFLSVNKDEPRVSTNIAVRTGSKNDPAEYTGLAHYLEHMLFKGTSELGSLDWKTEKKLLKQISDLYEQYGATKEEAKRKAIYKQIDKLSGEAARLVATNEYDQMVSELGARGTNAYTSLERTVYVNDIPANELEKWMMLESERFQELVLRLFHTELEAVYEEFNRTQDSDSRQEYYARMANLFPGHTYGTQNTIGTAEHLKNPSMEQIHKYFNTYYVPNNTAMILVGDLDPDKTVDLIKKHFGSWKRGPEPPQYKNLELPSLTKPVVDEVIGTEAEYITLTYRAKGISSGDELYADLAAEVLSNGKAGLIDQNLNQTQEVLRAYAYSNTLNDFSTITLGATPRENQSLDEVKELLLNQVNALRSGDFDKGLLTSIVRNAKKSQMRQAESNGWKSYIIINSFIYDVPWTYYANYYDRMARITKDQLVQWASANLNDNYVAIYKKQGERNASRITKPEINAVTINRGVKSGFRTKWEEVPSMRSQPEFVDYDKAIFTEEIKDEVELYHISNTTNQLFSLDYIFDMGSRHDKKLALAIEYLPYLGTDKYTVEEIKRKFYDLALDYSVYAGEDRVYVSLSGLNESMDEGVQLFEELLAHVKADPDAYGKLVDGIIKKRQDAKASKNRIFYGALLDYAMYGEDSPTLDMLSEQDLRAIKAEDLTQKIRDLAGYHHKVFYYGPSEASPVKETLAQQHRILSPLKEYPPRKDYSVRNADETVIYFVDYDQVQTELMMLAPNGTFNSTDMAPANVFNQYFGAGLSSIVFQEIRESKALAYRAYSVYTTPARADEHHFVRAYIGAQSDKMGEAVSSMQELMNTMPREESNFEQARLGALKQMETNPTTKASIFWSYQRSLDRGLTINPRPEIYSAVQSMTMDDMQDFFNRNIKGHTFSYIVIGKKSEMDMNVFRELGTVREMKLEEIFGY